MIQKIKRCIGICTLYLALYGCASDKAIDREHPNVVIILADDLGYGDVSCYGKSAVQTPQIDKLATEGVMCTDFYVPTPYCAPSRATLLTGRFPLRHGLTKNPTPDSEWMSYDTIGLAANEITLGEILGNNGYKTKLIGKWHLGHYEKFFPVNQGFDEYYGILYSNDMRPVQIVENRDTVEYPVDQRLLTQKYTAKAIDFITENKDQPFFLHLCQAMPHKPLAASDKFYTPETPNDLYQDVIRELDWSVGQVVQKLEELKILDNTILIFMSDNGPWYGGSTGGLKGMKATTWEGGTRVPFIIRYPKTIKANKVIDVPCWSPDILPTILALANITPATPNSIDGADIREVLNGYQRNHAPVFTMIEDRIMTVRKGNYKLFVDVPRYKRLPADWVDSRGPDGTTILAPMEQATPAQYPGVIPEKSKNKIQLFNVKTDKTESKDLAVEMPEKVSELLTEYNKFEKSLQKN